MANKIIFLFLTALISSHAVVAQFYVTNYYPTSAAYQDTVYIVGTDFGSDATDYTILLGKGSAEIVEIQNQIIKVLVPGTATYGYVTVAKKSSNEIVYLNKSFTPVYSAASFDNTHLSLSTDVINEEQDLYDLCHCDFDLDGDQDIGTVNNAEASKTTSVNVFSNTTTNPANPTFARLPGTYFNINQPARNIICGDLDGDGKPELIVSQGGNVAENIYIFKNVSSITPAIINFDSPIILAASNGGQTHDTRRLALHDLDGDKLPEIIVTNETANQIIVFKNSSNAGTISFPNEERLYLPVPSTTLGLAISDIDGDGKVDIIATENLGANFYVLSNQSTIDNLAFSSAREFNLSGRLVNVVAADIDGDSKNDLAITDVEDGAILLLLNQSSSGEITFASPVRINAAIQPWGITAADITGNTKKDLIVATQAATDKIVVLKNNSDIGSPSFELIYGGEFSRYRNLAVADFNSDAKPDIIVTKHDGFSNFIVSLIDNKSCLQASIKPDSPPAICEANPVLLSAPIAKNTTYQWNRDGVPMGGADQATFNAGIAGNYTVTMVDNNTSCSSTSEVVSIVEDLGTIPDVPAISAPATICEGETLTLSVSNEPGLSYFWSGPAGFESTETSPSIVDVSSQNSGIYQLEVRQGLCKSAVKTIFVKVSSPQELVLISSQPSNLCAGEETNLSFDSTGLTNIQWYRNGQIIAGQTSNTFTTSNAGLYQVQATGSSSCTVLSNEIDVSLVELQAAISVSNNLICVNSPVTFVNQSSFPDDTNVSYLWDFGDGVTSTEFSQEHTYTVDGTYETILTISFSNGSCSSSASQSVVVNSTPDAHFINASDILCFGDSLNIGVDGQFASVTWGDSTTGPQRWITESGTYNATVTNEVGCDTILTVEIAESLNPELMIELDRNNTIPLGDSVQFFASGADTYEWSPGQTLSDSTLSNPFAQPLRTTTYTLRGYNQDGCSSTAEATVWVDINKIPVDALHIFSPNGDGIEDAWVIHNFRDFPECYFLIFNVNGKEVYRSASPYLNDWEGTDNSGRPLPAGSYYYVVRCEGRDNKATGNVNIVR